MRAHEIGVSEQSEVFFRIPSAKAKKLFFYPICAGHFYCNNTYRIERANYDNYLLLFILRGSGYVEIRGEKVPLGQGSFAYINCYNAHSYYTETGWEILWLHFDGPLAKEYHKEITKRHSFVFHSDKEMSVKNTMTEIYDWFRNGKKGAEEAVISNKINNILTLLFVENPAIPQTARKQNPLKDTLFYISEHLSDTLSVDFLADRIFMSKYYFIRIFKKEVGYTPHEYILMSRINAAQLALKATSNSVRDIALNYGFANESSFCTTFKRLVGMTPLTYRSSYHK